MKTISYKQAVNWLQPSLILCNNITEIDNTVFDNFRFDFYNEEDDTYTDIYQYYLTSFSLDEVNWMEEHFPDMLFSYSELLDMYVLCVDHFGTSWDGVFIETDLENI